MTVRAWPLALTLWLAACGGTAPTYSGFQMTDFFPLDGTRTWEFANMNAEVPYVLDAQLNPLVETDPENRGDNIIVHRLRYTARCQEGQPECGEEGWKYDILMSANNTWGVRIWGYDSPATGPVNFDEAIQLAEVRMAFDDFHESPDVDGHDFVSTFETVSEDCDELLSVKWECARLRVESTPPGHWLAGTWWAVAGYNVVAWERTNDLGKWRATDVDWQE